MIAVVAGATGLVGNILISKLLRDEKITQVIAVSRRSLHFTSQKLKTVLIHDLKEMSNVQELLKGDFYFCCLGTTIKVAKTKENFKAIDLDAVLLFSEIAKKHNAQSLVIISAAGANPHSLAFYSKVKGEMEERVKKMNLNRLVFMRPGLLIGERQASRPIEELAIKTFKFISTIVGANLSKRMGTDAEKLAERMIEEALKEAKGYFIINTSAI